jgi:hypothetical protein
MAFTRGRYYQRPRQRGGRRWTEYYGKGSEAIAAEHAAERQARLEGFREARRRDEEVREAGRIEAGIGGLLDAVVVQELNRLGYGRISRGPWRWRPMKAIDRDRSEPSAEQRAAAVAEIARLAPVAKKSGDKASLDRLRELGRDFPDEVIEAVAGDPAGLARKALLQPYWGNPAAQDGLELRLGQLTRELAGEDPSPVKRLCAQVAAYSNLEFWMLQAAATKQGWCTAAHLRYLDAAHARHLKSIRTLAAIGRLERTRPRVIHATQVNVAVTPATTPEPSPLPEF